MPLTLTQTMINGGVLKKLDVPVPFYQKFFQNTFLSKSDLIVFEEVYEDYRKLSSFVAPNVIAKVNKTKSSNIMSFRPAYAKEKDVIEAWDSVLQERIVGEQFGGSLTPAQRAQMIRAKQLRMHNIKMENLFEWMCFNAFTRASVTVAGDDYPTTTVDYFRDAALNVATLGAGNWLAAGTKPLETIATMADLVFDKGQAEVDTIVMGRKAWQAFYAYMTDPARRHLFDREIRGSNLEMNLIWVGDVRGVQRVASFTAANGVSMEIYVDSRVYVTDKGVKQTYMGQGEVVGFDSRSIQGSMAFGAIKDADAGYLPARMHHKEFRVQEPSADYLLTQSAPLPINLSPNAVFRIADATV